MNKISDNDPLETQEWREALASVVEFEGPDRAPFPRDELFTEARRKGTPVPYSGTTPHLVRNPGMVPNETICGVRRFHRVVFQRCVRCPPILPESFKKLEYPRLPSQSATRPEHRYRLQMKLCRGF